MSERSSLFRRLPCRGAIGLVALAAALSAGALSNNEPTVEELKARVPNASVGERPHLCVQIAQQQLAVVNKLYAGAEDEKAQPALTDVVAFMELARDYSIQSHKYQKQTEIAARGMIRKLTEIMNSLGQEEQAPVRDAIERLQQVRDDLLAAMFPKGVR